jgi:uncharacterized protein (TIGR02246 family)
MASASTDAANDAMVREFLHAWERRDTEHVVDSFTDDAVYHNISMEPLFGKAAIRAFVSGYEGVPAGRLEIRHQLASDTVVINERIDHVVVDGRRVDVAICGVFEIDEGRIARWTDYYDSAPSSSPGSGPRDGFHTLTPRIVVTDVAAQVAFLRLVFDAIGDVPVARPAEIAIGDSLLMITSSAERELVAAFLYVYVDDADAVYQRALSAGAESLEAPVDTPYGDRRAMIKDPFGNVFQIAHKLQEKIASERSGLA